MADLNQYELAGLRLRAARLVSGLPSAEDAVRQLEVPGATYRAAESGRRSIGHRLLEAAAERFRVSADFLVKGEISSPADAQAQAVAATLARVKDADLSAVDFATRLIKVRRDAGYASASALASEMNWPLSTYVAHEGRRKQPSADRLISYALDLGLAPGIFFFDEAPRPVEAAQPETQGSTEDRAPDVSPRGMSSSPDGDSRAQAWTWLPHRSHGAHGELPVLVVDDGYLRPLARPMELPTELLEQSGQFFAVARRQGVDGPVDTVVIVRREEGQPAASLLAFDGRWVDHIRPDGAANDDPLSGRWTSQRRVILGSLIGELHFRLAR